MATFSHSAFLQALGWATLNSFWQMALLWSLYYVVLQCLPLSSAKKYNLALAATTGGFAWFILTFWLFYQHNQAYTFVYSKAFVSATLIDQVITAASVTYLCLLCFPALRLVHNWRYIKKLKRKSVEKAAVPYRLFVKKIAYQLNIKRPVQVYVSQIIKSPVTIGYLKPIILLPVAALNNLTTQQVEAVLLHELSHIRRSDYLINFMITVIHTLLYFNPFVKLFVQVIEAEREKCCDETVLQYQYNKLSYASALLLLEKQSQALTMAAAGKKHLLSRIEKIVGLENKPVFKFHHVIGFVVALLFLFFLNVFLLAGKQQLVQDQVSFTDLSNPFYFFNTNEAAFKDEQHLINKAKSIELLAQKGANKVTKEVIIKEAKPEIIEPSEPYEPVFEPVEDVLPVAFNLTDAALSNEQKQQVKQTVASTKKVLETYEWQEVEKDIADGMTPEEKVVAKQQYMVAVEALNWKKLEENLKLEYDKIDWQSVDGQLNTALSLAKLDSLKQVYNKILEQTNKVKTNCNVAKEALVCPDISVNEVEKLNTEVQKRLQLIKEIKTKKVIRL